jgi:predicted sulfurtransferase
MTIKQLRDHLNNLGDQFDDMVIVARIIIANQGFNIKPSISTEQFVRLCIDDIETVHDISLKSDQSGSIEQIEDALNIIDMNIDLDLDNRSTADISISDIKAE